MSTRDLRAQYGQGKNPSARTLINRAIRAELVGGNEVLDTLNAFDQLRQKWLERGWRQGLPEIETALGAVQALYGQFRAEIRQRYGLPPEELP